MSMKAARFHGRMDLRVEEVSKPVPKGDEVLIDVEWCGICGSDLHEYQYGPIVAPTDGNPHQITKEVMPVTFGHEFCGRVAQIPKGSKLKVGQAVMVDPRLYCSSCKRCQLLATNACYSWGFRGFHGGGGGLSESVVVKESMLYVLPESADLSVAALIEPLAVATHAVKVCGASDFTCKSVLILGGGPIGLTLIMVLRTFGARAIYVSEPILKRRMQNLELADAIFNPLEENVPEKCKERTGGDGVDFVFDCAGVERAMKDGFAALKYGGTYMNVAGWVQPFVIPLEHAQMKEITIKSTLSYNDQDFKDTVEAFSNGAYQGLGKFVTSRISLNDVVEKGFKELLDNKDDHVKILVSPKPGYVHLGKESSDV